MMSGRVRDFEAVIELVRMIVVAKSQLTMSRSFNCSLFGDRFRPSPLSSITSIALLSI